MSDETVLGQVRLQERHCWPWHVYNLSVAVHLFEESLARSTHKHKVAHHQFGHCVLWRHFLRLSPYKWVARASTDLVPVRSSNVCSMLYATSCMTVRVG